MAPEDEDVKLLMTIPGLGYYSALLVKSEIGDISRFPGGEKLCSYAGLVPSISSSGTCKRHGPITKEGSRWLRWIMVESVRIHLKYDTGISRAYHAIAERKGTINHHVQAEVNDSVRTLRPRVRVSCDWSRLVAHA
jgi:transposase